MKMQLKALAFLSFLFTLFSNFLFAQDIDFRKLPEFKQDELGYGGVTDITQDPDGYMWFVTLNGLYRYNGYQAISYHHINNDLQSLAYDHINTVYADEEGLIWIGTHSKGLDCLDPGTGIFKHFTYNAKDEKSISNDTIFKIRGDKKGFLWIATASGLNYFNSHTGKFIRYLHKENDPTSIAHNTVWLIYKDRTGVTWFGGGTPFSNQGGKINQGGLMRYNARTDNFTNYLHNPDDTTTLIDNHITAIFEDSRGTFWIGTKGDGLHTMNRANGSFERHRYDKAHPDKLSRPPLRNIFPYCDDYISFINEDADKKIWIGTFSGGINLFDRATQKITFIDALNDTTKSLKDFSYFTSYVSRDSIFWLASWLGELYNADPFLKKIPYTFVGERLKGAIKKNKETLWVYGDRGLIRKSLTTGIQKRFIHDAKIANSLSHNDVRCIVANKDNNWWIATYGGGLDYFDPLAESFKHYRHNSQDMNTVSSDSIDVVHVDGDNLWIGTRQGLDVMNLTTGKFSHFIHDPADPDNLQNSTVRQIVIKDNQTAWLGMGDPRGMNVLNIKEGVVHRKYYLAGSDISDIFKDHRGTLWVTTGDGLFNYDTSEKIFSRFIDPYRLTKFGATVNIQEDDKKNIWLLTHSSIYKISLNKDLITTYGYEYGVQKSDWNAANKFIDVPKEEVFLIDNKGYFSFKPADVRNNPIPPEIVISDVQIIGDSSNNGSSRKQLLTNQIELVLSHQQNTFSIEFLAIHFGNPAKNKIVFKLDNIDNDWREPGNELKAYYFNLPPGTYTFHLKACNYTGVVSERQLTITITPPWWKTWWFYTLIMAVTVFIAYSFYRYRIAQVKNIFNVRTKISMDLHDEVGSTLGGINMYIYLIKEQIKKHQTSDVEKSLNVIQKSASEMVDKLSDIVWVVNPKQDSLLNMISRLEEYAIELASPKNMKVKITIPDRVVNIKLSMENRRNIYLLCKEAINNAVKYSRASLLELTVNSFDKMLEFIITDNGAGFDIATVKKGNGIMNMQKRADEVGARFSLQSVLQEGTTVSLQCKIT